MSLRAFRSLPPRTQPFAGRLFTTAAPPPTPLASHVKASGKASTKAKSNAKKEEPKFEPDPNPFKVLYENHKNNRLAIAIVIICAMSGDAAVTYLTFFKGRKEGEFINKDTVFDKMAEKVAPHLISEEGLSPMER
ncbi:hypothetical protein BGZ76_001821 [Entomortierella beljakovae]|nr:hypothetical protein BGZ76_001821 [Entomortierella beljakovae]